jgi:V-type H+-transporting ATPase subunit a
MQLVQLFVQLEAAHETVDELGQLGVIQFRDLNPNVNAFHRNFVNEVKRCDEMERKLRFLEDQVTKEKGLLKVFNSISIEAASINSANINVNELEGRLDELEKDLSTYNLNQQVQERSINEVVELTHVLSADSVFFAQSNIVEQSESLLENQDLLGKDKVKLGYITGTITRAKLSAFERVLWRATRGNLFMRQTDIPDPIKDPQTGELAMKHVFIIFIQGDRLHAKAKKICESFGATIYPCPENPVERTELLNLQHGRLQDLKTVLDATRKQRHAALYEISTLLMTWKAKVLKEKAIFHTMNLFNYDVGRKCLIAEGWCPTVKIDEVQFALRRATQRANALVPSILNQVHTSDVPPTHFETNKFTHAYQEIVNAYGMAHYGEVNPAVVTLVTFPFLFGVMFGDVGHGFFLLLFSIALIVNEKSLAAQKLNEIVQMPFDGRYVLLVMSFYAIFSGFIYNEFFSVPMNIFGSAWNEPENPGGGPFNWTDPNNALATYTPMNDTVYPFGVDPVWKGAPNELDYYNSFKMKLSILLGIMQMSLGIFFSLLNYLKEKRPLNWINTIFQFIPQIVFLWCIFGYMCVLIVIKWCTDWEELNESPSGILQLVINMFLSPGLSPLESGPLYFPYQHGVQQILTGVAVLCIPLMLLVKPFLLKHYHKKGGTHHRMEVREEEGSMLPHEGGGHEHEEFEFAEVMIHQIIHTIEFVLGAISNTASYLRLWALSLAHSELSTVFWTRILLDQIQGENTLLIFVGFAVWAAATFAVLLVMETLSAFLHALRLHWVEFQNKFYIGDGVRFMPFSYKSILTGEGLDTD